MEDVDVIIRGHLEEPRIAGSASELLTQLYKRGRVSQFRYGEVTVGSVDLTADSHPIDIEGRPQSSISMFGVMTEGIRHFTAYIPSPRSRIRAFEDLGACVAEILGDVSARRAARGLASTARFEPQGVASVPRDVRPASVRGPQRTLRRDRAGQWAVGPERSTRRRPGGPARAGIRARARGGRASLARLTFEFLRPVPIGLVQVQAEVTRPGRRVQLLDGAMVAGGVEVVRARALRVLAADSALAYSEEIAPPPGPEQGRIGELPGLHRPRFATDAVEIRFVAGRFGGGPATAWFRLARPLVGDEQPSALQRLAAAGDFGAGLSGTLPRENYLFINTDLTLYVEREPVGEWICLDSQTRIARGGVGIAESVLYDQRGRVGRATPGTARGAAEIRLTQPPPAPGRDPRSGRPDARARRIVAPCQV